MMTVPIIMCALLRRLVCIIVLPGGGLRSVVAF